MHALYKFHSAARPFSWYTTVAATAKTQIIFLTHTHSAGGSCAHVICHHCRPLHTVARLPVFALLVDRPLPSSTSLCCRRQRSMLVGWLAWPGLAGCSTLSYRYVCLYCAHCGAALGSVYYLMVSLFTRSFGSPLCACVYVSPLLLFCCLCCRCLPACLVSRRLDSHRLASPRLA